MERTLGPSKPSSRTAPTDWRTTNTKEPRQVPVGTNVLEPRAHVRGLRERAPKPNVDRRGHGREPQTKAKSLVPAQVNQRRAPDLPAARPPRIGGLDEPERNRRGLTAKEHQAGPTCGERARGEDGRLRPAPTHRCRTQNDVTVPGASFRRATRSDRPSPSTSPNEQVAGARHGVLPMGLHSC